MMGTKRQQESNYGPKGIADVKVLTKAVKVTFRNSGDVYEIAKEDAPDVLASGSDMYVKLSGDEQRIWELRPASGNHIVHFKRFRAKEDEPPTFFVTDGRKVNLPNGKSFWDPGGPRFTTELEILEGPYAGMVIPYILDYVFAKDEDGSFYLKGRIAKTDEFMGLAGYDWTDDELSYEENMLPSLEELLQSRDKPFMARLNGKGFVDKKGLSPLPVGYKVAKKSARKATQKRATKKAK
jgi:hypothetical protein